MVAILSDVTDAFTLVSNIPPQLFVSGAKQYTVLRTFSGVLVLSLFVKQGGARGSAHLEIVVS